jgi:DNA-binding MarR family transcriptional regulator
MSESTVFDSVLASLPENAHYRRAWLELVRCFTSVERVLMRHFAQEFNSSLPRYDVLTALALTDGGLTMGELAAKLMVTKGNITGVVRRLQDDGLVRKATSKTDRRIQVVSISAKGRRLWGQMHDDYDRIISDVMRARTASDVRKLTQELEKMRIAVDNSAAAAGGG